MILYRYETRIDYSTSAYNVYYAEEEHYYVVKETDASYLVIWVPHDWTEEDCKADVERLAEHKPTLLARRCRWMRKDATRIFACADKVQALENFNKRKDKQLKILNNKIMKGLRHEETNTFNCIIVGLFAWLPMFRLQPRVRRGFG